MIESDRRDESTVDATDAGADAAGRASAAEDPNTTEGAGARTPEEIQRDIEATREELGETVDALAQKADVKAQFSDAAASRKEQLKAKQEELRGKLSSIGGGEGGSGASAEQAKRIASQAAEKANDQPMPFIAGAFAAGIVLGLLIGRR